MTDSYQELVDHFWAWSKEHCRGMEITQACKMYISEFRPGELKFPGESEQQCRSRVLYEIIRRVPLHRGENDEAFRNTLKQYGENLNSMEGVEFINTTGSYLLDSEDLVNDAEAVVRQYSLGISLVIDEPEQVTRIRSLIGLIAAIEFEPDDSELADLWGGDVRSFL